MKSLCGRVVCEHICSQVQYCELGRAVSRMRLLTQRIARDTRALQAVRLHLNVIANAGSFAAFSRQLERERLGRSARFAREEERRKETR
jgi:hypothetical protein